LIDTFNWRSFINKLAHYISQNAYFKVEHIYMFVYHMSLIYRYMGPLLIQVDVTRH